MAAKPEAVFKAAVNKHVPNHIYRQGMYTPYSAGTLDHYYETDLGVLWIEYKFITAVSPRPFKPFDLLTALQKKWYSRADDNNVDVGIIIGSKLGGHIFFNSQAHKTITTDAWKKGLLTKKELAEQITKRLSA